MRRLALDVARTLDVYSSNDPRPFPLEFDADFLSFDPVILMSQSCWTNGIR